MKKASSILLLVITAMFVAFTAGMLCGRHFTKDPVTIQPVKTELIAASGTPGSEETSQSNGQININTASSVLLDTLPGIGPVLAQRIVAYREENGPFASVEELSKVEGIGSKTLLEILNLITVED